MEWTRGRTIGLGSTAAVSVATDLHSGRIMAVKSVRFPHSDFLQREQRILSQLNCPHVVAYKGYDVTLENGKLMFNLFMEFAPGGSILDAMERAGGRLDEATVQLYAREVLIGLEYLHSNGVVHCDIKCHNILVGEGGVKIADFGCARRVEEVSGGRLAMAGTPIFMAPEVVRGEGQGFAADVWAVGCTVIQMVTGRAPWAAVSDPVAALYRIRSGVDLPEIPRFMSEEGKDFLRRCLIREPEERWSVSELLKHPFVHEQKSRPKQNPRTPTSILEQGFWDTINDSETLQTPTRPKIYRTPLQRIQQLSEVCKIQSFGIPNWESECDCDENWETVRSRGMEEEAREKSDCVNGSELRHSSESMAMATKIEIGNQNYVGISISRSSNCSKKISKAKKRGLPMTSVCNVTLKTIDFSYEKLCIVSSLVLVFAPCDSVPIELFDIYKNIDKNFNMSIDIARCEVFNLVKENLVVHETL